MAKQIKQHNGIQYSFLFTHLVIFTEHLIFNQNPKLEYSNSAEELMGYLFLKPLFYNVNVKYNSTNMAFRFRYDIY